MSPCVTDLPADQRTPTRHGPGEVQGTLSIPFGGGLFGLAFRVFGTFGSRLLVGLRCDTRPWWNWGRSLRGPTLA